MIDPRHVCDNQTVVTPVNEDRCEDNNAEVIELTIVAMRPVTSVIGTFTSSRESRRQGSDMWFFHLADCVPVPGGRDWTSDDMNPDI